MKTPLISVIFCVGFVFFLKNNEKLFLIQTDDQIALLQNAWAELLCLDCCWRSLQTPNEIKLSYNRSIDSVAAQQLHVDDIFQVRPIVTRGRPIQENGML